MNAPWAQLAVILTQRVVTPMEDIHVPVTQDTLGTGRLV